MYVTGCHIANVWTTCAGTSLRLSKKEAAVVVRNRNHARKMPQLEISNHFRPVGKRFEGIYRFTYARELKDIEGGEFLR
jgi:hypothetical protein